MYRWIITSLILLTAAFGQIKELNKENFNKATARGIVVIEFYAAWNEANKVVLLDSWEKFDAKVYRVDIEKFPGLQNANKVVILPTIIFYDEGEEVSRLQGDMSFSLKTSVKELDTIIEEILGSKF